MRRLEVATAAGILLVGAALMLVGLGSLPLHDYDEAQYAQVTREARSGHWLLLTYRDGPFVEKPPLYFWLAAGTSAVLGESRAALRLPSALAGVALLGATMLVCLELTGSAPAALAAGAILATTAPLIEIARQLRLDTLVTLSVVLSAYCFARALREPRWFVLWGAMLGLGILSKSVIALFALAASVAIAAQRRQWDWLSTAPVWLGVGACAAVALPWHLLQTAAYGAAFWREYVGANVGERLAHNLFAASQSNRAYRWYLANFALPWAQLALPGALVTALWWGELSARMRAGIAVGASTAAAVLAVFFVAATKSPTYLAPLYPFAAIVLGSLYAGLRARASAPERRVLACFFAVCLALGLWSSIYNGFHINPYYAQADELAREESYAAQRIAAHPGARWFAYDDAELGALMYESGNNHPLALPLHYAPPAGSLLVTYERALPALRAEHPSLHLVPLYQGDQLALFMVTL